MSSLFIDSGMLVTPASAIQQIGAGGVLGIEDYAFLRIGGVLSLPVFDTYEIDTLSTVEYFGSTQSIANDTAYGNLVISAAGNKTAAGPLYILNDYTQTAGNFIGGNYIHAIEGDWTMTGGTFNNSGSTVLFNGINNQSVSSIGAFNNLTINKASGLLNLASDITSGNITDMLLGKINLGAYNYTVGAAGSITNYNSSKYFIATGNGTLIQQVINGGNRLFPVGFTNDYLPATVTLTAGSSTDNFNVRLLTSVYYDGVSGNLFTDEVVNATWMMDEEVPGGSDATIAVQWPASLELASFDRTACRLGHYLGGQWELGTSDLAASGTDPYNISRSGITSFSPFAVGSVEVLPVTWLDISGVNIKERNHIYWETGKERDNAYFAVEASINGTDFIEIGRVAGSGNTNAVTQYSYLHNNLVSEVYYYRIRQVDHYGRYSYSKVIKITAKLPAVSFLRVYPNPVKEKSFPWKLRADKTTGVIMTVSDITGRTMVSKELVLSTGMNKIDFNMTGFPSGIYILAMKNTGNNSYQTESVIKQ
ncbi:MAG: T9SS type A sorting domain-containing protein [Bacteroidia bacterium]|nr:T9SS type A sorting domain-containing protein [Bacteroidia bacterium]